MADDPIKKDDTNAGATGPNGATGPGDQTGAGEPTGSNAASGPSGSSGPTGSQGPTGASGPDNKAPEKYDLKIPEGSTLKPADLEKIAAFAKEQGFSQKQAQAMVERDSKLLTSYAESQQEHLKQASSEWAKAASEDTEFGGDAFKTNAELAKRVITRFGTKELMDGLSLTGFGNHPELVRLFVRIGKAMTEDQLVMPGSKSAGEKKELADVFYPSNQQQ